MGVLADCEDRIESIGRPRPVAELPHPWLANGYYTLTFPCGTHKTLRIHTQRGGVHAGKRIISLLIGPVNTDDYEWFGEIIPAASVVWVWKAFKGAAQARYAGLLVELARAAAEGGPGLDGHELLVSRHCLKCNRLLTTEDSIKAGVGPECAKREAKRA